MRFALIDKGVVYEILIADKKFLPPPGKIAVPTDTANIGDKWDGQKFSTALLEHEQNILLTYAFRKQQALLRVGISVNIAPLDKDGKGKKPVHNIKISSEFSRHEYLKMLAGHARDDPSFTAPWAQEDGKHELNAVQILHLYEAWNNFVMASHHTLGSVIEGISAGSVKRLDHIDSPNAVQHGTMTLPEWPGTS
jgi:hypothetical protein